MSQIAARVCQLLPEARLLRADGEKWLTLYGPPGTGKTTAMLRLAERHLETGAAEPDSLMVGTFTRNARAEAFGRLKAATGHEPTEFPWVRTLHSACYRLLELSTEQVMGPKDYERFGAAHGYEFTSTNRDVDDPFGARSVATFHDFLLAAEELRRNLSISTEEAAARFSPPMILGAGYDPLTAARFATQLVDYKRDTGQLDFSDMLARVVDEGLRPPITHLFIDEAQDLTPLQWSVVKTWAETVRRVFVFGDDDQAIFEWSGADPRGLMQLPGSRLVLSKSHRLPSAIHSEALKLSAQISERVLKEFDALRPGGEVGRVWSWYEALLEASKRPGRTMLLGRNKVYLEAAREVLRYEGIPFLDRAGGSGIPPATGNRGRAVRTALDLSEGRLVMSRFELVNLQKQLRPGLSWRETPEKSTVYRITDVPGTVADALRRDPLDTVRMPPVERDYLRAILAHGGRLALEQAPSVELSTIHGVKGEEADTVIVSTAMTGQTYDGYMGNPDAEHRVFYVAATRSKESLFWLRTRGAGYEW